MTAFTLPPGYEDADPEQPLHPDVTVHLSTGCSSSIGAVMGKAAQALTRAGYREAADHLRRQVFASESYDEALSVIMHWVDVT